MKLSRATLEAVFLAPALVLSGLILPVGCCGRPEGVGRLERYPCGAACSETMAVGTRLDLTTMLDQMTIQTIQEAPFAIEAHPRFVRILAGAAGEATALVKQGDALFDYFPLRAAEAGWLQIAEIATSSIALALGTQQSLHVTLLAETGWGAYGGPLAGSFCVTPVVEGAPNTVGALCDESKPATASGAVLTLYAETVGTSTVSIYALGLRRSFVLKVLP